MNEFVKITTQSVNISYLQLGKRTYFANGLGGCGAMIVDSTLRAYDKQKTVILDWEDNYCMGLPTTHNQLNLFADYESFDSDHYFLLTHIICAMLEYTPNKSLFKQINQLIQECVETSGAKTDLNKVYGCLQEHFADDLPLANLYKYTTNGEYGYEFNADCNTFITPSQAVTVKVSELDLQEVRTTELFMHCSLFCMLTFRKCLTIVTEEFLAQFKSSFPIEFYERLVSKMATVDGNVLVHTLNLDKSSQFVESYKAVADVSYIIHPDNTPELARHPLWDQISQGYVTRDISHMEGVCIYPEQRYEQVVWSYQL